MTLEDLLNLEQSRRNIDQIIDMALGNHQIFEDLWNIFVKNKNPESRRAAWVIDILTENSQLLDESKLDALPPMLPKFRHEGMKRHTLRMIERNKISDKNKGELVDQCFQYLESKSASVAVKMYSIKILKNVAKDEPDLIRELIDIIEIQLPDATPGLRNIGRKTIFELSQLLNQHSNSSYTNR